MARLESILYTPHRVVVTDDGANWECVAKGNCIGNLPQIFWSNSSPWREANLWAMERATSGETNIQTVQANMRALYTYANWLEDTSTGWWEFPDRKKDRCLVRYRGYLVAARDTGELAGSTVTQRMNDVIHFYRWLKASGLLSAELNTWQDKTIGIALTNQFGLERTMSVTTTDLSIPNRKTIGAGLEGGLLPISTKHRDLLLNLAYENASQELFLFLTLGFYTGMRLGSISDLKVETINRAVPDPSADGLYMLSLGPSASPPVHTKKSVNGQAWITETHLNALKEYSYSVRRLKRVAKADRSNKDLLFLTSEGSSYSRQNPDRSSAINEQMHRLKKAASESNISVFKDFHFHQSRCTFATELAKLLLPEIGSTLTMAILREALLHKDESTSRKYVKFVESAPGKEAAANAFTAQFLGLTSRLNENVDGR
ncbi:tyrosine-type recombinase/integrase [Pseudomonas aeruginosa]|uniref:tyrosine-type recombinase/integrase n=1 Tax=Pseudomonas aeruginosa TaxID=287 RepID=UPI0039833C65|nr:site-specific integrase [Pseudomonas aeruginosa]HCF9438175.1 site-specific integrase [Pseudomonas aeruginosa]